MIKVKAFAFTGYPATVFLRPDGRHIVTVPGFTPADQFLVILRYIGDGHMDRGVDLREFRRAESGKTPAP